VQQLTGGVGALTVLFLAGEDHAPHLADAIGDLGEWVERENVTCEAAPDDTSADLGPIGSQRVAQHRRAQFVRSHNRCSPPLCIAHPGQPLHERPCYSRHNSFDHESK
jgi:hypothetical protein